VAPTLPTILLLDDNPDTLEMYSVGLAFAGFRLLTATRLEEVPANMLPRATHFHGRSFVLKQGWCSG